MKVLAIVGSPRVGGNTDLVVEQVMAGVREHAPDCLIDRINLREMRIEPCLGTLACRKMGECIIKDDMKDTLEKLKQADGVIVGSPIYRGYLTGQMKNFMDRLTPLEIDRGDKEGEGQTMRRVTLAMKLIPVFLQKWIMKTMFRKVACSYFRLPKPIDCVTVVIGGHPDFGLVRVQMNNAAEELGFLALASGGRVVGTVRGAGFLEKGSVTADQRLLASARAAGTRLAKTLASRLS